MNLRIKYESPSYSWPRLYKKVAHSLRSNVRKMPAPYHRKIKSAYDVTDYRGKSDLICEFYLSMLRRQHFPFIGGHRE